jgi:cytochrome c-type biogenesis protein CcmH
MKPGYYFLTASILALTGFLMLTYPASAQQPTPSDDRVNSLAREMYCPVCENTPLDVCPTQACAQWRDLIRQKMAQGWSDQQIKDYFVAQYGDRVLSEPPARGMNLLVYFIPPLLIGVAAFILYRVLRKMKLQTAPIPSEGDKITELSTDPYLTQMEEELDRYNKL